MDDYELEPLLDALLSRLRQQSTAKRPTKAATERTEKLAAVLKLVGGGK